MEKKKKENQKIQKLLEENPDFFVENPHVLQKIKFPDVNISQDNNSVISFKDWIIKKLKNKQRKIIENARFNFLTQEKLHRAIINLVSINEIKTLVEYMTKELTKEIGVDSILLVSSYQKITKFGGVFLEKEKLRLVTGNENKIILDAVDDDLEIFNSIPYKIYSNALCILDESIFNEPSLIALGSKQKIFFKNKGAELISFFHEVLKQHLKNIRFNVYE